MPPRKRAGTSPAPATPAEQPATSSTYSQPATTRLTPLQALHAEIDRTNAAIEWLAEQIHALTPDQLIRGTRSVKRTEDANGIRTVTEAGSTRHELLALFIEERRHLHALCRDALATKSTDTGGGWPRAS
jgi:hypothetical protein